VDGTTRQRNPSVNEPASKVADVKITDALRSQPAKNYIHHNVGVIATLGLRRGRQDLRHVFITGESADVRL
jgi:hypothetical protein